MQIVIDIPNSLYKTIQDCKVIEGDNEGNVENVLTKAVENGAVLSKGHGRLIDVSDIEWAKHREERNYINYDVIDWDEIVNAPTIIEADKGDKE